VAVLKRTFMFALAPESAGRGEVDGRRRGVVVGYSFDRVQPVVGRYGYEQT